MRILHPEFFSHELKTATPIDGIYPVSLVTNVRLCSKAVAAKRPSMTGNTVPFCERRRLTNPSDLPLPDQSPRFVPQSAHGDPYQAKPLRLLDVAIEENRDPAPNLTKRQNTQVQQ